MRTTALARVIEDDPDFVLSETGVRVKRYSDDRGAPRLKNHVELVNTTTNVGKETRTVKKTASILLRMYNRTPPQITKAEMNAGEQFYETFYRASLSPVGSTSFEWAPGGGGDISDSAVRARERLYRAIEQMGGLNSYMGSVAINVLGWGMTLTDWAAGQDSVNRLEASAFLRGALQVLVMHWHVGDARVDDEVNFGVP